MFFSKTKLMSELERHINSLEELKGESSATIGIIESSIEDLRVLNAQIMVEKSNVENMIKDLTKIKESHTDLLTSNRNLIGQLEQLFKSEEETEE